jgi:hypothetical protein
MEYTVSMSTFGMVYIPNFMKIDISIQALLRFSFRNLKGSNVGISDESDL